MILRNYLIKSIFSYTAAVSLVFLFIVITSRSIQYLEQSVHGEIDPALVFWLISFRLPEFIQLILPFGFFLAIILFFGQLHSNNEMVILHQCGISKLYLFRLVIILSILNSLFIGYLSFWLTPISNTYANEIKTDKTFAEKISNLEPDIFHEFNNKGVFFAKEKDEMSFNEVFIRSSGNDDIKESIVIFSKSAYFNEIKNNFILEEGTSLSKSATQKINLSFDQLTTNFQTEDDNLSAGKINTKSNVNFNLLSDWQWKISLPLFTLIISFIAIPLSKIEPRQSRYRKVFPALLIFIIYLSFLILGKSWLEQGNLNGFISLVATHLLFLFFGFYLLKREIQGS